MSMKKKLSNQFLSNYLIFFLMTIIATMLAFFMLSFSSTLISDTLAKNRYSASSIIRDDYNEIDSSGVVENGGGVQIIDKDLQVVYTKGIDTIGKKQISTEEFTEFLTSSKDKPYHYDVLYQPDGEFWLIVTFPTSIRLDLALVHNKDAAPGDYVRAGGVIVLVSFIYLFLLAIVTLIYSRITAAKITIPLQKLCDGTQLLREGDYSVRVDLHLKNEFAELQNTFNDMAARIEHEMSLRRKSENDRRRLILDISHDLKNPMSSIQGYAELCLNKSELGEKQQKEYLSIIHQNSQRANKLLSELFELSQMDSPDFNLKVTTVELCEYLRQLCGELVPLFETYGFEYQFDIPEGRICTPLDSDRFRRLFHNLADNAVSYNPKGTTIAISLEDYDGQAIIKFRDDGVGIPSEVIDDIFKPFVRVDDSRSSVTGGSGLGLSIAKKIAEAHGGKMLLESIEGKGSEFSILIPSV